MVAKHTRVRMFHKEYFVQMLRHELNNLKNISPLDEQDTAVFNQISERINHYAIFGPKNNYTEKFIREAISDLRSKLKRTSHDQTSLV